MNTQFYKEVNIHKLFYLVEFSEDNKRKRFFLDFLIINIAQHRIGILTK